MKKFLGFIIGLAFVLGLAFILNYPVMLLWNWVVPPVFGLPTVTFWQMYGITVLINLLFGNSKD